MIDKSLDSLRPEFRKRIDLLMHVVRDDLGIDLRVHETRRTAARQIAVLTGGASQLKIGKHNFGLAVDFGIYIDGVYQKGNKSGLYTKFGLVAVALGFRWGGNWDMDNNFTELGEDDLGHVEDPSITVERLIAEEAVLNA